MARTSKFHCYSIESGAWDRKILSKGESVMNRTLTAASSLAFTALLAFAALSYATDKEKLPHLQNHFEGKVVVVSSPNVPTVVIINPRLFAFYGRVTLAGDEIIINHGDIGERRTYSRTGGMAYVTWDRT